MFKKLLLILLSSFFISSVWANNLTPEQEEKAYERIFSKAIYGPTQIKLENQATFNLPKNMLYLPKSVANDFMDLIGNGKSPNRIGIVMADDDNSQWLADILFEKSGYISNEDAKNWDADELLESLREGDKIQNEERRKRGIAELQLVGWIEKPTYDPETNRLVWSIESKEIGANATAESNVVNYNTYVLGREGYVELTFVTDVQAIKTEKLIAKQLLSEIKFNSGKTYEEYNSATDAAAEYGLAALIGGAAVAKKLGLFGIIAAFFVKFWKIIAVAVFALFPLIGKLLKKKKSAQNDSNTFEQK